MAGPDGAESCVVGALLPGAAIEGEAEFCELRLHSLEAL